MAYVARFGEPSRVSGRVVSPFEPAAYAARLAGFIGLPSRGSSKTPIDEPEQRRQNFGLGSRGREGIRKWRGRGSSATRFLANILRRTPGLSPNGSGCANARKNAAFKDITIEIDDDPVSAASQATRNNCRAGAGSKCNSARRRHG